jgi:hypothetical protein
MPNDYPKDLLSDEPDPSPAGLLNDLERLGINYDVSTRTRAAHGRDWWPLSIPDVARGVVPHWPGVVVFPQSTEQVSQVLNVASPSQHASDGPGRAIRGPRRGCSP